MTELVDRTGTKLVTHESFRSMSWNREIRILLD